MSSKLYQYPPYMYLMQVAEHCPKAVALYLALWREIDKNHNLHVYKDEIQSKFMMSPTCFKNNLTALVKEGLVSVNELTEIKQHNEFHKFSIEVVAWDDDIAEFGYVA